MSFFPECIQENTEERTIQHPILGEAQVLGTHTGTLRLRDSSPGPLYTSENIEVDELLDDESDPASYSVLLDQTASFNRYSQIPLQTQAPYQSPSGSISQSQ